MKFIARYALFILILALLYLLLTGSLLSASPFVIGAQLAAIGLAIWARRSFPAGQFSIFVEPVEGAVLLSDGPYQYVRHPMYLAALLLVWASVLGHLSLINVAVGLLVTGVVIIRILVEERALRARYPSQALQG